MYPNPFSISKESGDLSICYFIGFDLDVNRLNARAEKEVIHSLTHSLTYLLTYLLTHLLTYSLTHSLG